MEIFAKITLSIVIYLLLALGLEVVIESFVDQDQPLWIYLIMAMIGTYYAVLHRSK